MIVVADTTPLRYLIEISCEHVLPGLYGEVIIPVAVAEELQHVGSPSVVSSWMAAKPSWLAIRQPKTPLPILGLDRGELEAIVLAEELTADLILIDEWDGRSEAKKRKLATIGTLRVLSDGAKRGLVDLENAFMKLRKTNFRVSGKLLDSLLVEYYQSPNR